MLELTLWALVAAATILGAAMVAVADGSRRRAGLWTVVLGTGGLLLLLGVDLAVLAWLGLAAPMVLLCGLGGSLQPAADRPRPSAAAWRRLAAAAPALLLGGVLVGAVLAVDWQGRRPPSAPVAAGSEVGGRLLVNDLALLAGCGLLVAAVLASAAAARGGPSGDDRKGS